MPYSNTTKLKNHTNVIAGKHKTNPVLRNPEQYPYLAVSDICLIYGYSKNHIHMLCKHGKLDSFKGGHVRYVYTYSMLQYLAGKTS